MNTIKLNFTAYTLITAFIMTFFMTSCEQDNTIIEDNLTNITNDHTQIAKQRFELAKNLSLAIQEPEFANALKVHCTALREDGYYETEFFFNLEKDKSNDLLEGKTLDKALTETSGLEARNNLDFLYTNDPGLAILMVNEDAEAFNTRVYIDNGYDDNDPNAIIKYYENGELGEQLANEEPNTITFIVRESEAYLTAEELIMENPDNVTVVGNVNGQDINVFGYNTDINNDFIDEIEEGIDMRTCQRDNLSGKERLYKFKTSNNHEGWGKGSGEFIFDIVFGNNSSTINTLRDRRTGIDENQWYTINKIIITWSTTNDLDRMKYIIHEDDGGATYNFGITLSGNYQGVEVSGTVGVTLTDDDDFVGEKIVEYCDPIQNGSYYHSNYAGAVTFECREF